MSSMVVPTKVLGIDASRAMSTAPTGTEAYSYHLIRAVLSQLDARQPRYQPRLYFRNAPNDALFPDVAYRIQRRVMPFPRMWTHLRLSWEMLRRPPDILWVPAHVLPLIRPRCTLATVHDLGYLAFPEAHPRQQRWYLDVSTRWNVTVATHVIADSCATRDAIVSAYKIPIEKITVAYPGYDDRLASVLDAGKLADVRRRYAIPGDYVLFIGRIQPRKNLSKLIEAFAQIAQRNPGLYLVLAGPAGWMAEPIKAQIDATGLRGRVVFPGYVQEQDKAALISGARVFAYPSLYEGFGFPALEAQACGTPLLTSNSSSLPEVAGDGGLLVDPLDTAAIASGLDRLLHDAELRSCLVERGSANLTRFSWQRTAQTILDAIDRLAAD